MYLFERYSQRGYLNFFKKEDSAHESRQHQPCPSCGRTDCPSAILRHLMNGGDPEDVTDMLDDDDDLESMIPNPRSPLGLPGTIIEIGTNKTGEPVVRRRGIKSEEVEV